MPDCPIILVAEDDEDYVLLIKQVFAKAHIPNPVYVVWNGEEVISYLKGEGKYSNRDEYPLPDILLLDLKMPRVSSFESPRMDPAAAVLVSSSDVGPLVFGSAAGCD